MSDPKSRKKLLRKLRKATSMQVLYTNSPFDRVLLVRKAKDLHLLSILDTEKRWSEIEEEVDYSSRTLAKKLKEFVAKRWIKKFMYGFRPVYMITSKGKKVLKQNAQGLQLKKGG